MKTQLQATATQIMSQISSVAECDKQGLEVIIGEAYDAINRYISANENIEMCEKLLGFYKWRKSCGSLGPISLVPPQSTVDKNLKMYLGDITREELYEEWTKRIGAYTEMQKKLLGDPAWGHGGAKDIKRIIDILTKEIEELNAQKMTEEEFNRKLPVIMLIPPDYRYPLALETMLRFVRNLRASNWKECANLYEEQLHRWHMEMNSAEGLELQRQTKLFAGMASRNSALSAVFSGLNLIFK